MQTSPQTRERNRTWIAKRRAESEEYRERCRVYSRAYAIAHREERRAYRRKRHLREEYNLTIQEFADMLLAQEGKCAMCGILMDPPTRTTKDSIMVTVDHCHETGRVRGLLCHQCNFGLGIFKDSLARLRFAVAYLERDALVASTAKASDLEGEKRGREDEIVRAAAAAAEEAERKP